MSDPFVQGLVAGALLVLAIMVALRFMRRDERDISAPPQMTPRPARPMPDPLPPLAAPPGQRPEYNPQAVGAIADALDRGQKIEAIKLLRAATGLGLAEAKTAVEDMERQLRG